MHLVTPRKVNERSMVDSYGYSYGGAHQQGLPTLQGGNMAHGPTDQHAARDVARGPQTLQQPQQHIAPHHDGAKPFVPSPPSVSTPVLVVPLSCNNDFRT
jgi:hypothetical protein